ncbi:AMP-binding protein [Psychrobacillus sp. NPDC096426]|uniref:AMP-binding protein n=1 Tax=Psychrobacillus sp. NPDC096426 TaxID=3364491 RepID=UPI003823EF93
MKLETLLTANLIDGYQSVWPYKTILNYLNDAIEKYPQKVAIIDKNSRYTYEELGKMVDRVALGLLELGIKKGDVVSIQLPNWNEFIILHYAITRIGAITNPLIPIYREREISYMVGAVESKILIIPAKFRNYDYVQMVQTIRPKLPSLKHLFVIGDDIPDDAQPLSYLFDTEWETKRDPAILNDIQHDPNDVTEIIFTSGTTGNPKGVMHTHNTLCVSTNFWIEHLQLTSDDVMFMASTFAHQTGFGYGVRLPTHIGGTAVYQDIWNPGEFLQLVEKEKITFTAGATPFLQDTIQSPDIRQYNLESLRAFVALGAPIPRALIRKAADIVNFSILSGWGQSEDGLVTLTKLNDSEEKLTNTDGVAFPSMAVKVVDADFNDQPANVEGSLLCKGPALFVGYLKQMEQTLSEFHNGWFKTGDRAIMDEDGYIRISGRDKDVIIRGGENIPVVYIENILYEHPDVAIAQIVAMPDLRMQEKACAFIRMKPDATPLTLPLLQVFLEEKGVAKQYWPERLEILENFPQTASGKIQKFKLRELITEEVTN